MNTSTYQPYGTLTKKLIPQKVGRGAWTGLPEANGQTARFFIRDGLVGWLVVFASSWRISDDGGVLGLESLYHYLRPNRGADTAHITKDREILMLRRRYDRFNRP